MKQILKYFSVLLLTIATVSCSSDDNANTEMQELIVKVDKMAIDEGETVLFNAVDTNNKTVGDVDYYVNNTQVSNPYKFDKKGTFNVIARKSGYKTSTPKTILVGRVLNNKLELVADKAEIIAGENVVFKVLSNGEVVNDCFIDIMGQGLMLGNDWTSLTEGTFKFYAFKGEYLNSNIVTVTVKDKPIVGNQFFSINGEKYSVGEVQLAAHVKAENDENPEPYLYTDKTTGRKFQVYELVAINKVRQALTSYLMGVYVADNETKFVYPSSAKPEEVFSLGGVGVIGNNAVVTFKAEDIQEVNVNWTTPLDPSKVNKGKVKYNLITKDKKVEVIYDGEFSGLSYVPIPKETKNVKNTLSVNLHK